MDINIISIAIVLVVILISMTLHEVMHGFMAYALGDDTAKLLGRLTFNPVKHVDPFLTILLPIILFISNGPIFGGAKPVPFNPARLKYDEWGAALVALAGPLTNLLIAFILYGVLSVSGQSTNSIFGQIMNLAIIVNLGFFAFNMIPFPPLDGSRVLYALAPDFFRRFMEQIERFGIFVILALVLLFSSLISQYIFGIVDLFESIFARIYGR